MASPSVIYRDAAVVTSRPIVPGPVARPEPPEALSSGSQLNRTAVGGPVKATELDSGSSLDKAQVGSPWPKIINGAIKFFHSWHVNSFREIANHNVSGNYGEVSSLANYGFRGSEFGILALAGMPLSNASRGNGHRPEWNNLIPIIYGLRVINPVGALSANYQVNSQTKASQFTRPTDFTPTGPASLSAYGTEQLT